MFFAYGLTWFVDGHLRHDRGRRQRRWRWVVTEYVLGFELGRLSDRYGRRVGHGGHCRRGHHQRGHGQHSGSGGSGVRENGNRRRGRHARASRWKDVELSGKNSIGSPPFHRHGRSSRMAVEMIRERACSRVLSGKTKKIYESIGGKLSFRSTTDDDGSGDGGGDKRQRSRRRDDCVQTDSTAAVAKQPLCSRAARHRGDRRLRESTTDAATADCSALYPAVSGRYPAVCNL